MRSDTGRVNRIIGDSIPCDVTLPWCGVPGDPALKNAIPGRYRAAGWGFLSLTIATDEPSALVLPRLAAERRALDQFADVCIVVETVEDIRRAKREGKLALGLHFQGTLPVERNLDLIALYYKFGIRHMLMAYNQKNFVADGCHELGDGGLSRFGHELVAEMNRVGMVVDVAHTAYRSSMDTIFASKAPVIVSHGNVKAISDHPRCYADDQIKAIAGSGGVIGLTGLGIFMGGNDASNAAFVRQVDHVVQLVGVEHAGFGLDYVYDMPALERHAAMYAAKWPSDGGYTTPGIEQIGPERLPEIVDELLGLGYSDADVIAILGGNWIRVFEQVWK